MGNPILIFIALFVWIGVGGVFLHRRGIVDLYAGGGAPRDVMVVVSSSPSVHERAS